jgi:hypothetical protein
MLQKSPEESLFFLIRQIERFISLRLLIFVTRPEVELNLFRFTYFASDSLQCCIIEPFKEKSKYIKNHLKQINPSPEPSPK